LKKRYFNEYLFVIPKSRD